MKRFVVISMVLAVSSIFGALQYSITVPNVSVELDKPNGSYYSFGSYFEVKITLDAPAYVKVYATDLEGRRELLYPKGLTLRKFYPGRYSLGRFRTNLYGLVYVQVIAVPDTKTLDQFKGGVDKEIKFTKIPRLKFPRGSDVAYMFYGRKERYGILEIVGKEDVYVTLDDELEFKSPKRIFLRPGKHVISYEYDHTMRESVVYIQEGVSVSLNVEIPFQPIPVFYTVSVRTSPSDALVFLDGDLVGKSPLNLKLDPGYHVIRVEKTGYETYEKLLNVDGDLDINLTLRRGTSEVTFLSVPGSARIFVNGREIGIAPVKTVLNYGCYQITYIMEGYETRVLEICIDRPREEFSVEMIEIKP